MDEIKNKESAGTIDLAKDFAVKKFKEAGVLNHWPSVLAILQNEFGIDDEEILIKEI